ncbi:HPr family phosphocarrier protein [Nocardia thailandica]|uniref:HPr family phosphocarrier protein n=1 Tax=Nocardia thailandica TaxID=257275 RepID=A0ABW6PIJ3_9NOCA
MYVEVVTAAGPLTADTVEELLAVGGRYTSRVTLTVGDRTVQLPVLGVCGDELGVTAGTAITVEADRGHRPADAEDRAALAEVVAVLARRAGG